MQKILNLETSITENQVRYEGNKDKKLSYTDLIEYTLDILPQGGFTPKDLRDRQRIQQAINNCRDSGTKASIELEDMDFKNLVEIVQRSRWTIRHIDLSKFLDIFNKE